MLFHKQTKALRKGGIRMKLSFFDRLHPNTRPYAIGILALVILPAIMYALYFLAQYLFLFIARHI